MMQLHDADGDAARIFHPAEPSLSDGDFRRIGGLIHELTGLKMTPLKKIMVESRLRKRLRARGLSSYEHYCRFLFSPEGMRDEVTHAIDAVTTNKTDFFREPGHFDYLLNFSLPELVRSCGTGIKRPLRAWSAGCATGEEPYSLAMVFSEYALRHPGFRFSVLGTDISTRALETAVRAIYHEDRIEPIPSALRKRHLMRSKDRANCRVRISPELRQATSFRHLNLMDADYGIREPMDVIFCRNVLIYFERRTQEALISRLIEHLAVSGYLFMGHSETLHGMDLPLRAVHPMIYRRRE